MRAVTSLDLLERLGKTRLSRHFFARDFLYSEIGSFHAIPNLPGDVDLFWPRAAHFAPNSWTQWSKPLARSQCGRPIAARM